MTQEERKSKVDTFLAMNAKNLPMGRIEQLRENLMKVDDTRFQSIQFVEMKNPTTMLIISLFLGGLGIDRFMVGDIGLGVGKLLTAGGCGVWAIIDWFLIQDRTRECNAELINSLCL